MSPATPDEGPSRGCFWTIAYRLDIVTSVLYLLTVAFNTCLRSVPPNQNFAEVHSGLTVLEAGADLSMMYLIVTSTEGFVRLLTLGLLVASIFFHHVSYLEPLFSGKVSLHPVTRTSSKQLRPDC
jgi:hypothetical protein